jgi:hypothetical protein
MSSPAWGITTLLFSLVLLRGLWRWLIVELTYISLVDDGAGTFYVLICTLHLLW